MSARFEFAFSCRPTRIAGRDRQDVRQTISALLVTMETNQDCNQEQRARSKAQPADLRRAARPFVNPAAVRGL